jgi:SAM-dependent methyltransferase
VSGHWGYDRGLPIDRRYIEAFLAAHGDDIRGDVLEVKDDGYSRRFGHALDRVDVLDVDTANTRATVVGDLGGDLDAADASYDCFVLTQTLQYVWDVRRAIEHAHRLLRPSGVLLLTVPAVVRHEPGDHDLWRFTRGSVERLLATQFDADAVEVQSRGNLVTTLAVAAGLSAGDLGDGAFAADDERYPVIVAARAVRG